MGYLIFRCSTCGKINMAKDEQKTKICAFCGTKNKLLKVKILAKASSIKEAKQTILNLKVHESGLKKKRIY